MLPRTEKGWKGISVGVWLSSCLNYYFTAAMTFFFYCVIHGIVEISLKTLNRYLYLSQI